MRIYLSEVYGTLAVALRRRLLQEGFQLRVRVERRAELPIDALRLESCLTVPDDSEALAASLSACALIFAIPPAADRRLSIDARRRRRQAFVDALDLTPAPEQLIYVADPLFEERLELTSSDQDKKYTEDDQIPSWCLRDSPAAQVATRAAAGAPYTVVRLAQLYETSPHTGRLLPLAKTLYSGAVITSWLHCDAAVEGLLQLWLRAKRGQHFTLSGEDLSHAVFHRTAQRLGHGVAPLRSSELAFAKRRLFLSLDSIGLLTAAQRDQLVQLSTALSTRPLQQSEPRSPVLPPLIKVADQLTVNASRRRR
ncbi:MAG: hypothetical protein VYD19_01860 [Myxococcota bacterium]|nr:hypothetical protein [Myxococcota bacterium]